MSVRLVICRGNALAPDPRVDKEARALAAAGHQVTALGCDRSGSLPRVEDRDGFRIRRLAVVSERVSGLHNLWPMLRWQAGLFRWLAANRAQYDLIHACDFDTVLPALLCKCFWKKKVIYDIFDLYADMLRATPAPLVKLVRRVELFAIGKADATLLADDARREQIAGSKPRRLEVIYNAPEDIHIKAGNRPPGFRLYIAYIGLIQKERGLLPMLHVLQRHPEWHLDLAGYGGDEKEILQTSEKMENVTWHGRVPYEQALQLSAASDVLFALYDPSIPNHRYSSPNKIFEAMLLGKPVIVAQNTNMDRLIATANCGLIVKYGAEDELETALKQLADHPELRDALGQAARKAYDHQYSWNRMQTRLIKLYEEVSNGI